MDMIRRSPIILVFLLFVFGFISLAGAQGCAGKSYRTLDGVRTIPDELAKKNAEAKAAQAEDFVDSSFVKKLDEEGFFDRLYKR